VLQLGPNDERGEPGDVSQDEKARLEEQWLEAAEDA